jgi:hypothetical protein
MAAAALLEATAATTAASSSAAAASTASPPGAIQGGKKTGPAAATAHTPAVTGFVGTDRSFDLEGTEEETAAQRLAAPSVVAQSASRLSSREAALNRADAAFLSDEGGAPSHGLGGDGADTSFSRLFTMAEYDALASYARVHPVAYGGWYRTNFGDGASLADTPRGAGQQTVAAMVPPPPGAHSYYRSDRTPEPTLTSTAAHGHATELRNTTVASAVVTTSSVGTAMASTSTSSSHHHHHRRNATELALALLESDNRLRLLRRQRDAAVARVDGSGSRPSTIPSAAAAA